MLAGYLPARKLRDTIGAANIDRYLFPVVAVIVVLSLIPIIVLWSRAGIVKVVLVAALFRNKLWAHPWMVGSSSSSSDTSSTASSWRPRPGWWL